MKKVLTKIVTVIGIIGISAMSFSAAKTKKIVYVKKEPPSKVKVIRVQRKVRIRKVKPTKKIVYVKKEPARKK